MHDPRVQVDFSGGAYFPIHWLKCPDCGTRIGPYVTMALALKDADNPRRCSECWFDKQYSKDD